MDYLTFNQKTNVLCNTSNFYYSDKLEDIINKYNISYTKNNNGIFLNISLLDNDIVNQLYQLFINDENINNFDINDNIHENFLLNSDFHINNESSFTNDIKKVNIKHTKLDFFILKTLKENLNLI